MCTFLRHEVLRRCKHSGRNKPHRPAICGID
jgi:hypothetical protein